MANHTILLIDYEPKSIDKVKRPLTACGYTIEVATDGIAGLEAFHRLKPDLVMIEAMIPKKHGFEVCQEIKKTPQGKRTPIIITTSVYKGRKYRNQAFHIHGCDEYLEKPLDEEQIVTVCRRMLGDVADPIPPPLPSHDDELPILSDQAPEPAAVAPVMIAPPPMLDDDELEILARLDAILPGGGSRSSEPAPKSVAPPPAAPAPVIETHAAASRSTPTSSVASAVEEPKQDMFATSFLSSSASAEVANEASRAAEVLEEPSIVLEDESEDDAQVVPFDSKRNRKRDRKPKKGAAASSDLSPAAGPVMSAVASHAPSMAQPAALAAPAAEAPYTPAAASSLPDLEVLLPESSSSRPWWVSVAIAVVLLGAAAFLMYVYLGGLFGGPTR